MHHKATEILCLIILCTLLPDAANARPKSVGATFSYAGSGLVYEYQTDSRNFAEIRLRAETFFPFADIDRFHPGISASFTYNMQFAEMESRYGNRIIFFAGPGATVGYTDDMPGRKGFILGLKGRIGGECTFRRNISVSISIAPVLGVYLGGDDKGMTMLFYKAGLLTGIMPEVGVKYAF